MLACVCQSPASSPSQLSEHGKFDLRTAGDGSQQRLQHPATSRTATDDPAVWQQSRQRSQGQAGKSTWGNNAAVFDKMQFSRHYFTQKHGGEFCLIFYRVILAAF